MNYYELLELLDIAEPSEFDCFEEFAELIENEDDIEDEALYRLLNGCEGETLTILIENYFEEILESLPDEETDVYVLLENIKRSLIGKLMMGEDSDYNALCDEIQRFREWFSMDNSVECENIETGEVQYLPVRDAITLARVERLDGDEHRYDFQSAMNYEIDEYVLNYSGVYGLSEDMDDEEGGFNDSDEL